MDALTLPVQPVVSGVGVAASNPDSALAADGSSPGAFSALLAAELLGTALAGTSPETGAPMLPDLESETEQEALPTDALALAQPPLDPAALPLAPVVPPVPVRQQTAPDAAKPAELGIDTAGIADVDTGKTAATRDAVAALTANSAGEAKAADDARKDFSGTNGPAAWESAQQSEAAAGDAAAVHGHAGMLHLQPHDTRIAAPTTVATLSVDAPVGSPGFADSLSQQVVWMAGKDAEMAELRLNPPELGPVSVRITVSGDEATAIFVSPIAEVRGAIEESLERLREALAGAGISLGETSVSAESFSDRSGDGREGAPGNRRRGTLAAEPNWIPAAAREPIRRGLVDLYA
jgi:flagellar hook-length control protein FliK